ncbi:MAG TPA: CvpA family protein [Candidatus Limnocylindrales bacterium]|nr:CvpA family protein [Candidatus Limnocylindrales bacterium]
MVDLVLIGIVAGFARAGWSSGFVRRLFGLVFIVASFVLATYLRPIAGGLIESFFPKVPDQYAEMVGYSITFSALVLVFNLFSRAILSRVAVQGIARRTDQLLGVLLGVAEGVLLLSVLILILHTYSDAANGLGAFAGLGILQTLRDAIESSTIGRLLEDTTVPLVLLLLGPFLPTDIKSIVPTQIPGGLPFFPTGIPGVPTP